MGNSEFAFLLKDASDLHHWMSAIEAHNECPDAGETLVTSGVLNFVSRSRSARPRAPSGKYLLACNMGGRQATMEFMARRRGPGQVMLGAFDKPKGWRECTDFVWRPDAQTTLEDIF